MKGWLHMVYDLSYLTRDAHINFPSKIMLMALSIHWKKSIQTIPETQTEVYLQIKATSFSISLTLSAGSSTGLIDLPCFSHATIITKSTTTAATAAPSDDAAAAGRAELGK